VLSGWDGLAERPFENQNTLGGFSCDSLLPVTGAKLTGMITDPRVQ